MRKALVSLILATVLVILSSPTSLIPVASGDPDPSPGEIWACDFYGNKKEVFYPDEDVYVKGVGLQKGVDYQISIVADTGTQIGPGDSIPTDAIVTDTVPTDPQDGSFGPTLIWSHPLTPGYYDVFADCLEPGLGTVGIYDSGIDAKDEESPIITTAGLFVITEVPLGTITVLFAGFTATLIIKRKRIV